MASNVASNAPAAADGMALTMATVRSRLAYEASNAARIISAEADEMPPTRARVRARIPSIIRAAVDVVYIYNVYIYRESAPSKASATLACVNAFSVNALRVWARVDTYAPLDETA